MCIGDMKQGSLVVGLSDQLLMLWEAEVHRSSINQSLGNKQWMPRTEARSAHAKTRCYLCA